MAGAGPVAARLACVTLAVAAFLQVLNRPGGTYDPLWVTGLQKMLIWVLPAVAVSWWLAGGRLAGALGGLGLVPFAARGVIVALACTLPFGLAWWVMGHRVAGADELAGDVILGPFAEEVLFRGFLFLGLRSLGWRFWSAGLVSALAFGLAHVPNLTSTASALSAWLWYGVLGGDSWFLEQIPAARMASRAGNVTLQIAAAGILFAWTCDRWQSLWPAIALHTAINFWWIMTFGPEGAFDAPLWPPSAWTTASVAAIGAAVVFTWLQTRRPARAAVADHRGPSVVASDP